MGTQTTNTNVYRLICPSERQNTFSNKTPTKFLTDRKLTESDQIQMTMCSGSIL